MYRSIPVTTTSQAKALDERSAEAGVATQLLMENAARATVSVICRELEKSRKVRPTVLVVCGPGNNGGDGLAIARLLHAICDVNIKIFLISGRNGYKGDSRENLAAAEKLFEASVWVENEEIFKQILHESEIVVDAIFGSGLSREISVGSVFHDVIGMINQRRDACKVFSVDIPSGVDGNSGRALGVAVHAHVSVTYGSVKIGSLFSEHVGNLYFDPISIFPNLRSDVLATIYEPKISDLRVRPQHSDKFSFGQTLFIAGSGNYFGAPQFSSLAFLKAGGGYSRLLAPRRCTEIVATRAPEIVMHATAGDHFAIDDVAAISDVIAKCDCVVIGPGLGLHPETQKATLEIFKLIRHQSKIRAVIVDGDALTILARHPEAISDPRVVLTPHIGELARLVGVDRVELASAPVFALEKAAELSSRLGGATVVVKNSPTFVVNHNEAPLGILSGDSSLATAGTGDVLTGVIAALLAGNAGNVPHHRAIAAAVWLHGRAGGIAAERRGADGVTASDVLEAVPEAVKQLRAGNCNLNKILRV